MAEEKKERKSIAHYFGVGVAIATVLSAIGGYLLIFIVLFTSKGKNWHVLEKGVETAKIAVINLKGAIIEPAEKNITAHFEIVKNALKDVESDGNVKAVVLRINSPGGEVAYVDRIYDHIMRFKQKNPSIKLFSFIESVGASGGYYLACAGDYIMAEPESIVGSIGVIFGKLNAKKLMDNIGLEVEIIKSSRKKDFGSIWRAMSEEEREMMNKIINSLYERFVDIVAKCRNKLPKEVIRNLADASIYTGRESATNGLVDEVGYFPDLLYKVKKAINVENPKVSEYYPKRSFIEELMDKISPKGLTENIFSNYSPRFWLLWDAYILR